MKLIIAGGRNFDDYDLLTSICNDVIPEMGQVHIVSGCANGADKLGERYASENDYHIIKFPADWDKHGKSAGYIRNKEMAKYADALIAFWDGKSKGTKHMIDLANEYRLLIYIHKYN